jgi:hypothetical protein
MLFFSSFAKSQVVFLNNPANHIVAYNPAFSAIHPYFNRNYSGKQVTLSSRVSQSQKDAQLTGQYFFEKQNIGLSVDYGYVNQSNTDLNKVGMGLAYQLLFFNAISTGWGVGVRFNDQQTNSNHLFKLYNKEFPDTLHNFQSVDVNFGGFINYERFIFGFSYQPRQLATIISNNKAIISTTQTLYFKTYKPITRKLNAIFWYQGVFTKQYLSNETKHLRQFQYHTVNIHFAGKKGLIGGIGSRITDFTYYSLIGKLGFNHRKWQILYGIEPYWLQTKYSEIIHELSFTLKFN